MPSVKIIGFLVLEKKIFKDFTIYGHGGHLGNVACTIYINFLSHLPGFTCNFALIDQLVSEKMFENNGYIHVYSPVTWADNPLRVFVSLTVLFSQYSPLLQIFLN